PKQVSQVDSNTEAIRQFIEIMKRAKKTLAKKPGPGKEKVDKIHIDRFLDDLVKDDTDPDSNKIFKPEINLTFHKQDESKTRSSASSVQVFTDSSSPSSKDNNVLLEEWHAPTGFSPDFSLSSKDDFLQSKLLDDKSEMSQAQSAISPEIRLEAQLSQDFTFSSNHEL
ncbi:18285_t:CDS:2, partial [Gigaspora rosea]